jgi:anhydro-N-acetylmuramic acid kinase
VHELLSGSGLRPSAVLAIGAHGQTVRHRPQCFDDSGYTIQLNNPALLAELTGIDVVADFRSRDVAAGGQGAPLVPAFHLEMFGQPGRTITVLNIGGISNLSVLDARDPTRTSVVGFDCGPGNVLLDYWCHQRNGLNFDAGGQWAASGQLIPELLEHLASDPYFSLPPPKSTGRDLFNPEWLQHKLSPLPQARAQDVQATLTELTALTCCAAIEKSAPDCGVLIVCGGGALNTHLLSRISGRLPKVCVKTSDAYGLPPQQVEATAFAWLACKAIRREPGNIPAVTGAASACILGGIYPA